MYIINYLSKKDINFYLTLFHVFSICGISSGLLINILIESNIFSGLDNNDPLNQNTLGTYFVSLISLIFGIFTLFYYSEAHNKKFQKLSVSMIGRTISEHPALM